MPYVGEINGARTMDTALKSLMACHAAGEDPRVTIQRLNARVVDCQSRGFDLPAGYLALSRTLTADCLSKRRAS